MRRSEWCIKTNKQMFRSKVIGPQSSKNRCPISPVYTLLKIIYTGVREISNPLLNKKVINYEE